jgi:cell division septation protein DedD
VRAAFFLLLFANLAFLAWAEWIDAPEPVPMNAEYAKLPRLKLTTEVAAPTPRRPSSAASRKTAMEVSPPAFSAVAPQCLSIGPFDDQASATRGASALHDKGFAPRPRTTEGEVSKGFWVFIGDLKTDQEVEQVLRTLQQSHVDDAREMPTTGDIHKVSIGLFSDRDRADHRAQSIEKLGLHPEVTERKVPGTVFWMDVDVAPGATAPSPQDLVAQGEAAGGVQAVPCPTSVSAPPSTPAAQPVPPAPEVAPAFRTKVATGEPKVP